MKKDDNKTNKNIITEEQHKAQKLFWIMFWIGMVSISLFFFSRAFSKVPITHANIGPLSAFILIFGIITFILFTILFVRFYLRSVATPENLKFRFKYLIMLIALFLMISVSAFSLFLTPTSIKAVGGSLVVATTISSLIDLEFYKHMKEYIIKMLKDQKTKRGGWWLIGNIIETFAPMVYSILALFFALVALMTAPLPYSFVFIDLSFFLMLYALIMPITLFAEDLVTQVFEPSTEIK